MYKWLWVLISVPLVLAGPSAVSPDAVTLLAEEASHTVSGKMPGKVWMAGASALASDAEGADARPAQASDKPLLTFSVLSDIHVGAKDTVSQRKLSAALADLHDVNPEADALVINGDLTNGTPADYSKLRSLLKQAALPEKVRFTIGNHEFYKAWLDDKGAYSKTGFPHNETDSASISRFLQFTGEKRVYNADTIGEHRFIFLGSEQYRQSDPDNEEDAYLSADQLAWLKKELSQASSSRKAASKPIFVFLHQPLPYTVAGSQYYVNTRAVIQHKELKTILSAYPQVILFTAHTHWELKLPHTLVRDRFTMVNSSSVGEPLTDLGPEGEKPVSADASEGLYVEVYRDRVEIKGRDFYHRQWIPEAQFAVPIGSKH
ncbi:metallophosphoesterase [Paenibacillus filicis]|uniref:Metallophosphoesterase n=1 Tax=Paenibacillus filicis TaxID=669464 RepID=A0ABU9DQ64_9BACL